MKVFPPRLLNAFVFRRGAGENTTGKRRSGARRRSFAERGERLFAESLEGRAMLATIVQVDSPLAPGSAVGIGQTIPFQVIYDDPVAVLGSPQARVNVQKAGGPQALAQFTGTSAGGRILNFSYTVAVGDVQLGTPPQFDVQLDPVAFLIGGTLTNVSDGLPSDRTVSAGDVTMADWNPGLRVDGVAPPVPTVSPTLYVNPTVWESGAWAAIHPDYFVVKGTAGTGPLPADEVLTVTVNGATYRATSTSPNTPGNFFVDAFGRWEIRIRPVGGLPATAPFSGSLDPWSPVDSVSYNVVARLTDAAGNVSTDTNSAEIVIDMIAPGAPTVSSDTPAGTYTVGDVIDVYVQYNEPIRVVGTPTLELNVAPAPSTAVYDPVATAAWAAGDRVYFTYTVQPGDSVAALDYAGTNALQLNGGFIEDLAANPAPIVLPAPGSPNSLAGKKTIAIDTSAPTVVTPFVATTSPAGTYVVGSPPITLTVTFDDAVFVTGTPQLQLNSFPGRVATYSGGSGTTTLSFTYVVQPGDDTTALNYASTTALQLNGGQIRDLAGNDAVLTLPGPNANPPLNGTTIVVAATPTVIQVSSPNPAGLYTAGDTVQIRVMFDKVVTVATGPSPVLQLGTSPIPAVATWARYIDGAGNASAAATNISEFEYLVQPGDTTNGQFLNYLAPTALQVGAGMNLVWTGPAIPGFLAVNPTLPPLVSGANILPNAQIVIGPDTTAPAAPIINLLADTFNAVGVSPTDGITSNPQVNVSGLSTKFGTTWQYQYQFLGGVPSGWLAGGPISATGTSTFTLATTTPVNAVYPVGSVQIRQTDWSGNVSPIGVNPQQWTIDINAPAPPTAATITETGGAGSGITNNPLVTVSGLEANAIFQYNLTYNSGTNTVNAAAWTTVASGNTFSLPQGTYNPATGTGVVVRQQDLAGNFSPTPPWTQLSTVSGSTVIVVTLDTSIVPPVVALSQDTTPGFAPYAGAPYTTDGVTRSGLINVTGLETQDLTATPPRSGIARWEYRVNGGAWVLGGTTAPTGSFTLPAGVYPPGSVEVREFDLAGNQATVANTSSWTVDLVSPTITSLSAPAGPYGAGQTVPITVNFSEPIFLSAATATLSLNVPGRTAALVTPVPVGGAGTSSLTFNYVVQVGDATPALAVTAFNLAGSVIADLAGNVGTGALPTNPVVLGGPIVINAGICASSPNFGTTAPGPFVARPVTRVPIQFSTAVTGFSMANIRLFWNERSTSLFGATLTGSGANYELSLPQSVSSLDGEYRLQISPTGIVSFPGGVPMTQVCNIYWQIGTPTSPTPTLTTVESTGNTTLSYASDGFLRANGTTVRFNGNAVAAANSAWSFLAAETLGGVNTMVLRHTASGSLHLWRLDSGWNFVAGEGWFAPNSVGFFATEAEFAMDFDGDGNVGSTLTTIESVGSVTLARDGNGLLRANGTLVRFNGSPVAATNGSWSFLAAEVIGGVNTMVLRHSSGFLHLWQLDSSWNFVSGQGWYAPGSAGFHAVENSFGMDFDGDGAVGNAVIESTGSVTLARDGSGFLRANGNLIRFSGNPVAAENASWSFLAADVISGVNTVVLRHSTGFLHLWQLDSSWNFVAGEGWYAPGSAGYLSTELAFGMDFNGTGVVGA
jgi:hypothetical protein